MGQSDKSVVKSVAKAFRLMEAFDSEENGYILADLARLSGLDNGTTHRLLNTLEMLGYVEKIGDTRRFRLTLKCLHLGFNAIARTELRSLARPLLRRIVENSVGAASIGVLDGNEVVYVERIQPSARLVVDVHIGNRVPLHSSALGLAILSCMPEKQQLDILRKEPLRKFTPYTVTDVSKIVKRLRRIREAGYVVSEQENVIGLRVIAAPLTDVDGYSVSAISAAAPAYHKTCEEFESENKEIILRAAAELSEALRASGGAGV